MLIKEYRIVMPLKVEEYQIGQLYSICQASLNETGGGEGVEVIKNEPFDNIQFLGGRYTSGQYTFKKYHLSSKVPAFIRLLAPKGAMEIHEEAWNAFPYTRTVLTNPDFMKENFELIVESLHLPDRGDSHNVLDLSPEKLKEREVVMIDIANDSIAPSDYKPLEDPSRYHSDKGNRGPLVGEWQSSVQPVCCCYKVVSIDFKWFGLQSRIESFIHKSERRLFTNFHRQVFCWMDKWYGLSIVDIREYEKAVRDELDRHRNKGDVRGMRADEK